MGTGSLQFHAAESWSASRLSEAKYASTQTRARRQARRAMTRWTESLLWHAATVMSVSRFLVARCVPPIAGSDRALPCCAARVFLSTVEFRTYARGAPPPRQECAGIPHRCMDERVTSVLTE